MRLFNAYIIALHTRPIKFVKFEFQINFVLSGCLRWHCIFEQFLNDTLLNCYCYLNNEPRESKNRAIILWDSIYNRCVYPDRMSTLKCPRKLQLNLNNMVASASHPTRHTHFRFQHIFH